MSKECGGNEFSVRQAGAICRAFSWCFQTELARTAHALMFVLVATRSFDEYVTSVSS